MKLYFFDHQNSKKQRIDYLKNAVLKKAGISLIRVAERKAIIPDNTEYIIHYDAIKNGIRNFDGTLKEIFALISSLTSCSYDIDIDVERDTIKIWEQYIESEKENSITKKNPALLEEWNFEKNGSLRPEYISYASNKKVWWKCKNCGYEWKAPPSRRVKGSYTLHKKNCSSLFFQNFYRNDSTVCGHIVRPLQIWV